MIRNKTLCWTKKVISSFGPITCGGSFLGQLCLSLDVRENDWRRSAVLPEARVLAGGAVLHGRRDTLFMAGGMSNQGGGTLLDSTVMVMNGTRVSKR